MNKVYNIELNIPGPTLSLQEKTVQEFEKRLNNLIDEFRNEYGSKLIVCSQYLRRII